MQGLGLGLGAAFGVVFGVLLDNVALGIALGPSLGLVLGIGADQVRKRTGEDLAVVGHEVLAIGGVLR